MRAADQYCGGAIKVTFDRLKTSKFSDNFFTSISSNGIIILTLCFLIIDLTNSIYFLVFTSVIDKII